MGILSADPNFSSQINGGNFGFQDVVVGDLQEISAIKESVVEPSAENDEIHCKHAIQIV